MPSLTRTGVEWVVNPPDNEGPGFAWNPITGCLKRCEWCYAWRLANGRLRKRYLANKKLVIVGLEADQLGYDVYQRYGYDAFWPRWWPERQYAPFNRKKPSGIFTVNMGDLCGPWIADRYIEAVLHAVRGNPQHRFYFLTKFPERLPQFNPWPKNAWVGATATGAASFFWAYHHLRKVKAAIRYISFEPVLEPPVRGHLLTALEFIDWLIIGPCTGKLRAKYPCNPRWLEEIGAACDLANFVRPSPVAVFEKDACASLLDRPLRREFPITVGQEGLL